MTLSRKDHYILAVSQIVDKPKFYMGEQETKESLRAYREEVHRIVLELMKIPNKDE